MCLGKNYFRSYLALKFRSRDFPQKRRRWLLPVLAVVHEQPIEMDHVIHETNRVRQPQNFLARITISFQTTNRIQDV